MRLENIDRLFGLQIVNSNQSIGACCNKLPPRLFAGLKNSNSLFAHKGVLKLRKFFLSRGTHIVNADCSVIMPADQTVVLASDAS